MKNILDIGVRFPSANVHVEACLTAGPVPEVHMLPSPKGGPEAMWFCFDVTAHATPAPERIRCVLHNPDTLLGGGKAETGFHPVYRTHEQDWQRVEQVTATEAPDGRRLVAWEVPGNAGCVRVALCYPYAEAEFQALTEALRPEFRSDTIGVTQEDRPLIRLSNDGGASAPTRPGIYCLARQHAGETPGSWVLDGLLRELAQRGDEAPLTWAVPWVDPDGVMGGCYGKDRFPWDFNRAWGSHGYPDSAQPEAGTHPMRYEVMCLQADIRRWSRRCRPLMALDFHAPGMCEDAGIYCFLRELAADGGLLPRDRDAVTAFHEALGPLTADPFYRSGRYASRWNTARFGDFMTAAMQIPEYTFEVPYGRIPAGILTRDMYRDAGRRLADAVCRLAGQA